MPDWLAHVLVGYTLATALSVHYDWLTPEHVTIAMVGALVPDLSKAKLVLPSDAVAAAIGLPFDWGALHTVGGSLVVVGILACCFPARHRRVGLGLLLLGALSHHALDLLLTQSSGFTYRFLWPMTEYRAPSLDVYRSTDREPAAFAMLLSALVWYGRYRLLPTTDAGVVEDRSSPR